MREFVGKSRQSGTHKLIACTHTQTQTQFKKKTFWKVIKSLKNICAFSQQTVVDSRDAEDKKNICNVPNDHLGHLVDQTECVI